MPSEAAEATIQARGLTRRFGSHTADSSLDLDLNRGEVLGFLGPNVAGKTTTMQMLTGNLAPSGGSIAICGIDLLAAPVAAKAKIGYLPETPPLYRELTVDEYLLLAAKLHRIPRSHCAEAVTAAKRRCGLSDAGRKLLGTLSRGFQQRAGIAQAIIHNPDVIILDEPTVGLDPNQIREIRGLIRELGGAHSVILSTHILPEVETVCDRVQILHLGNIVYSDTIAALKHSHDGRTLVLGLHQPPGVDALARIPGVVEVRQMSPTLFQVCFDAEADATARLAAHVARHDWGLYQIAPARASIEEVFVHLTRREEETQGADELRRSGA
jgi:ABC-2 type transport system ATP-binding protein